MRCSFSFGSNEEERRGGPAGERCSGWFSGASNVGFGRWLAVVIGRVGVVCRMCSISRHIRHPSVGISRVACPYHNVRYLT
uniref:Uncharacterized protein n=1 Tax=Setaria digitata TaxID=48799 RepID=A0A915PN79_9BILA